MEHLKSCPFCGRKKIYLHMSSFEQRVREGDHAWHWIVGCPSCDIWFVKPTAEKAIEAWNRRDEQRTDGLVLIPCKVKKLRFWNK